MRTSEFSPETVLGFAEKYLNDVHHAQAAQEITAECPYCLGAGRTLSLSLKPEKEGVWLCNRLNHCGETGGLMRLILLLDPDFKKHASANTNTKRNVLSAQRESPLSPVAPPDPYERPSRVQTLALDGQGMAYWVKLGIPAGVVQACEVMGITDWGAVGQHAFYFESTDEYGNPVGGEFRALKLVDGKKVIRPAPNSNRCYPWGLKYLKPYSEAPHLILTEGRKDALAVKSSGFDNAISIHQGVASLMTTEIPHVLLDSCPDFFIAMDADFAGRQATQKFLPKLLGTYKGNIWLVDCMELGCKDLADVLLEHGPQGVEEVLARAKSASNYLMATGDDSWTKTLRINAPPDHIAVSHPSCPAFGRTHLHIIYGNTGQGKSTFAMGIAADMVRQGYKVAYFSLEMDLYRLEKRFNSFGISARSLYANVHRGRIAMGELAGRIRHLMSLHEPPEIIFLDNFMMIDGLPANHLRWQEGASQLVTLAKELNIAIVLVAHTAGNTVKGCPETPEGKNMLTREAYSVVATWRCRETHSFYAQAQKVSNESDNTRLFHDVMFTKGPQ